MSKQVPLAARPRAGSGSSEARALRRDGRVPAIAYGREMDATPLSVDSNELYHALNTAAGENAILRLEWEGEQQLTLAREIQRHPVKRHYQHVDFVAVTRGVKVSADIPIRVEGEAPGTDEGGVLEQPLYSLPVEVLPLEMPDEFVVDVSELGVGDTLRVADVPVPEGVDVTEDPESPVVTISYAELDVPEPGEEGLTEEEIAEAAEEDEGVEDSGDEGEAGDEENA
ncbi:50S ribosomal protein L25 [Egibacter rhizosphaerae]|uniref:Large ribosomal subunit protein bL25 n=1 Tax=Egibacter rhizosphaerae TaxID=1670831 RepID=A0A411YIP9_9ACTN|nr:50S ribosomal protein L25 [Egibacter rhizosphaerae]QBI21110.1 50S ribosomal protein L25 [Egibacter rhizosphaerae]